MREAQEVMLELAEFTAKDFIQRISARANLPGAVLEEPTDEAAGEKAWQEVISTLNADDTPAKRVQVVEELLEAAERVFFSNWKPSIKVTLPQFEPALGSVSVAASNGRFSVRCTIYRTLDIDRRFKTRISLDWILVK